MRSEKQKMLAGEAYSAADEQLVRERLRARQLCHRINHLAPDAEQSELPNLLSQLLGYATNAYITPPFYCDYGTNIKMGRNVYFNFNCVVLDVATVTFGDGVLVGPAVQIYTAAHPLDRQLRRSGLEYGKPIAIGDDVWIGGGAILCPGVTVGAGSVIGAGSVVTGDIPAGVLAVGNPCRIVRAL